VYATYQTFSSIIASVYILGCTGLYLSLKQFALLSKKKEQFAYTLLSIYSIYLCFTAFKIQHVHMSQMLFPPVMTIMYLPLQGIISLLVLPLMHQVAGDYMISDICPSLYSTYRKRLQAKDYSRRSAIWRLAISITRHKNLLCQSTIFPICT
jgi:hypothetical protein